MNLLLARICWCFVSSAAWFNSGCDDGTECTKRNTQQTRYYITWRGQNVMKVYTFSIHPGSNVRNCSPLDSFLHAFGPPFFVVHGLHLQRLDESFGVPKSHDYHHFFAENLDVKTERKPPASDMSFKLHVRSKKGQSNYLSLHLLIGMCCCFTAPAIASP